MVMRRSSMQRGRPYVTGNIRAGAVGQKDVNYGTLTVSRGVVKSGISDQVSAIDRCALRQQKAYNVNKPFLR